MPAHNHSISLPRKYGSNQGSGTGFSQDNGTTSNGTGTSDTKGGDGAHNNMQPTAFVNAMIKL